MSSIITSFIFGMETLEIYGFSLVIPFLRKELFSSSIYLLYIALSTRILFQSSIYSIIMWMLDIWSFEESYNICKLTKDGNKITKEMFFTLVDGIAVFDKVKFGWLIESKDFLPNSYTTFKSNIMLTTEDGKSLRNTDDVILSFPYKDCIVEMDSTKEIEERKEVLLCR